MGQNKYPMKIAMVSFCWRSS